MSGKKKKLPKRRKKPTQPSERLASTGGSDENASASSSFHEMVTMLAEAGAPHHVLKSAADAHRAADNGDLEPLFNFFRSIGLDPDRMGQMADDYSDDEDWDDEEGLWDDDETGNPGLYYPMSSLETAIKLQDDESEQRSPAGEVAFVQSILANDPDSLEPWLILGCETSDDSQAVESFHKACEIGEKMISQSPELTPHFIGYRDQMGCELAQRGRLVDALEVLQPAMKEDERDGAGTRFLIIDLMLRLGWWDELGELLDARPDDDLGPGMFANAIRLNHLDPNSDSAVNALKAAHEYKPLVAPLLISPKPLPVRGNDPYSLGSQKEAELIAGYLMPGLRANPGTIRWIRDTVQLSLDSTEASGEAMPNRAGFGQSSMADLDAALESPQAAEDWTYHGGKISTGEYVSMVIAGDSLLGVEQFETAPKAMELRKFIMGVVCAPVMGKPRRPEKLVVGSKAVLNMLQKSVGTYGVACEYIKPTAGEKAALKAMSEQAGRIVAQAGQSDSMDLSNLAIDELPSSDSVWITAVLKPPMWIGETSTPYRPYVQMVFDPGEGIVLKSELTKDLPSPEQQAAVLADAMHRPMVGAPSRPMEIRLHPDMDRDGLSAAMGELPGGDSVDVLMGDEQLTMIFESMVMDMVRSSDPIGTSMIEQDDVDAELMRKLYQAAARFYRQAPWNLVGGDQIIGVSSGATPGESWGACVMGQLGQAMGLSLIQGIDETKAMILEQTNIQNLVAISIQYDEAFEIPPLELWQIESHGFDVANEEGFPVFMKIIHGDATTPPNAGEIQMVTDLLNAIPSFLQQNRDDDAAKLIEGASTKLELQWIEV